MTEEFFDALRIHVAIHLRLGLPRQLPEAANLERDCWWNCLLD